MTVRAFLDTNVLVYLYDSADERKQRRAREVVMDTSMYHVVSTQVLGEFYVTVTRRLVSALSPEQAKDAVSALAGLPVAAVDRELVAAAISTSIEHQLSYWDGLILETAVANGCEILLTEDMASGSTLRGVRIENPFSQ